MNTFETPTMEVYVFSCQDVITSSYPFPDVDDEGYNNEIVKP